ncbi:hypothetical protein Godav_029301 [Gossypium davidsonii]|uniref:Uncharacterized protein n=2 Tax=Gossypium TaxID=3633 RepID=A0A7J8TJB0_GOSDV|nr:hypothetical protein [Gossypium davidsonii]
METSPQKQAKVKVPKSKTLKGKRARLYIIRRCIFMLLCWKDQGDKNLGGRSLASLGLSSSSGSLVERLTQEKRSREEKKAETTVALTQVATSPNFSREIKLGELLPSLLSILILLLVLKSIGLQRFETRSRRILTLSLVG